jgi:MFS transporter, DHA2 family, multidrug resistance protein
MFLCVYLGIPRRGLPPERGPSWLGFTYFSLGLALLVGAFDQGERLYWMHSGVIVGMFVSGAFLLVVTCIIRGRQANPLANLAFLNTRNIIILATSIFLGNIQGFRALQTGQTLAWVALPQFLATRRTNRNTKIVWLVALAIIHTNSRLVMAVGFTAIGAARSAAVLNGQVRVQALSLAYSDAFLLIGWGIAAYLLLIVCMRPSSINLRSKEKTV